MNSILTRFPAAICSLLLAFTTACGGDDSDAKVGADPHAPKPPSALEITLVSGGAHLTWKDNSDNEDYFAIMKDGEITTKLPFDTLQYHDGEVQSGRTYAYMIHAGNKAGETATGIVRFETP